MHRLVTVQLHSSDDDVKRHLEAELRERWEIKSVMGIPIAGSAAANPYAVMAVVLSNDK